MNGSLFAFCPECGSEPVPVGDDGRRVLEDNRLIVRTVFTCALGHVWGESVAVEGAVPSLF